jgi:tetratricopeptide (TPR) repeat protein
MAEGDKALADGRAEDALAAFDGSVEKDPLSAQARQRRGQANLLLHKFDKAVDDCTAALKSNPKLVDAYFTRGQAQKSLGEAKRALDDFSDALDQTPDRADIRAARGTLYQQMAEADANRESMRKTLDSALKDFEKVLRLNPRDTASLLRRAEINLDRGDSQAAIDDCNKALEIDPGSTAARVTRARGLIEKADLDKAIADCDAAIAADEKRPDAHVVRAKARVERSSEKRTLHDIAECDKAADDCYQAIFLLDKVQGDSSELRRAKKWSALAHELRGALYDYVSANQKAFDEYSTAISMDPGLADALVRRALNRAKGDDLAGAMNDCRAAIAIDNAQPEGYYARGMVLRAQRQYEESIKDFEEALARDYLKANSGLAIAYSALAADMHTKAELLARAPDAKRREDYKRALDSEYQFREKTIESATKALPANRNQSQMYLLRGLAYVNSDRESLGFADFNAAIQDDPLVALAYYYRGIFLFNNGRLDDAIADFTRTIELQPNAVLAYERRAKAYLAAGDQALATIDAKKSQELAEKLKKQQNGNADSRDDKLGESGNGIESDVGTPMQPIFKARKELQQKLDATAVK